MHIRTEGKAVNSHNPEKILIIESSKSLVQMTSQAISNELSVKCITAVSFKEAKGIVLKHKDEILIAVTNLFLPDSKEGEIVDFLITNKIPIIVLTANIDDDLRERILAKPIIDYVVKHSIEDLSYLIHLIHRIKKNFSIKILVVDDSSTFRHQIRSLLERQQLNVLEASNGKEALIILSESPDIKMIITDYVMPEMNGYELTLEVRKFYRKDELVILAITGEGRKETSARFVKSGANDYIIKPYLEEEFYCRVNMNLDLLETIEEIRNRANRDYLTGLYNRRYFFDIAEPFFANAKRDNIRFAIAILDIDNFKIINDTFGHRAGDSALKTVSAVMKKELRDSDIIARYGGEEFIILAVAIEEAQRFMLFERLRQAIENLRVVANSVNFKITVSIGVCIKLQNHLSEMIETADRLLYSAKATGKNKVIVEQE